jgi:ubiquinone/menaquinone biosynthesis C-methylase UbiE
LLSRLSSHNPNDIPPKKENMRKKLKTYRRQEVSLAVRSSGRRRGPCVHVVAFLAVTTVTELRAAAFGYLLVDRCIPGIVRSSTTSSSTELTLLLLEHNATEVQLHNIFQQITWDASADAKTARALTSTMSLDIAARVERAIDFVAAAVVDDDASSRRRRCLDVGCGFGTWVPMLTRKGVVSSQIYGIDLSPQMIRNAQKLYPDCHFVAGDFLQYQPTDKDHDSDGGFFGAILFCSALHDFPDQSLAIAKASSLLLLGGVIVIVHAQGHDTSVSQSRSRATRTAQCGRIANHGFKSQSRASRETALPNTPRDVGEGYLAVFTKI